MLKKTTSFIRHDPVLAAAFIAALVSAFFVPPSAEYINYIDYRVLCLLLSGFTDNYPALLPCVNLGGLSTLIASIASVISCKLYAAEDEAKPGTYLGIFTAVNAAMLAVLWIIVSLI